MFEGLCRINSPYSRLRSVCGGTTRLSWVGHLSKGRLESSPRGLIGEFPRFSLFGEVA